MSQAQKYRDIPYCGTSSLRGSVSLMCKGYPSLYTDKWIARSIDSKTSRSGAEAISTPSMEMGPRIREWADMSQPQRATFPSSGNHVRKPPANVTLCWLILAMSLAGGANQRLGDCDGRLIPESPPCQLKSFSPLDLLSEIAVIPHVELDPKLEKGRRHCLPLSQTQAKDCVGGRYTKLVVG
jgi:hypothetical protein